RGLFETLYVEIQKPDVSIDFKALVGNPDLQNALGRGIAAVAPSQMARFDDIAGRLDLYSYSAYKADAVVFAQTGGLFITGALLGVGVAALMIRVLSSVFSGFYKGITLTFHVEWTSVVIAICLGILLTFIVVAFSAYRVSRLNIVAAIRDLDESEQKDAGMVT